MPFYIKMKNKKLKVVALLDSGSHQSMYNMNIKRKGHWKLQWNKPAAGIPMSRYTAYNGKFPRLCCEIKQPTRH